MIQMEGNIMDSEQLADFIDNDSKLPIIGAVASALIILIRMFV